MKLNEKTKIELRKEIEKELKKVPNGQRVKLDDELLEELIFDKEGRLKKEKIVVWSGNFLSKLDLSNISFDNINWDCVDCDDTDFTYENNPYRLRYIKKIDLSNTNAKIDIFNNDKFFLLLNNCNFSNTDLSNNTINEEISIYNCDFSNTGIKLDLNSKEHIALFDSNFSGIDLSNQTVDESFFAEYSSDSPFANNCNFSNTKLNIKTTPIPQYIIDKIDNNERTEKFSNEDYEYKELLLTKKNIETCIEKGYLDGCYIDGKLISTDKKNKNFAQQEELKNLKALKNYINYLIDKQSKTKKR